MDPRVVWFGPVASYQVHAPASDVFVQCVGAQGAPICEDLADAPGGLTQLLAKRGVPADQPIVLRAFSAGGHALKRYLRDPAARDRTVAVVLSDASFEKAHGAFDEGFVAYGSEAANEVPGRIFVATASSSGNPQGVTDSESLEVLRQKIEERTGKAFAPALVLWASKSPVKAWLLGRAMLLDFGGAYTHAEQATVLAAPLYENVVRPWLAAPISSPPTSSTSEAPPLEPGSWNFAPVLAGAAFIATGVALVLLAVSGAWTKPRLAVGAPT